MANVSIRTNNLRRKVLKNVTAPTMRPTGPNDGIYCTEYTKGLLRIKASNAATTYDIAIFTFENDMGNDWIEDPTERRSIPAGEDYTRMFRVGPVDAIDSQITAISGSGAKVDIFWTFS